MKGIFKNLFKGMIIGIAEIIPGVSGSTLALAMGIYDDLINFISNSLQFLKTKLLGKIHFLLSKKTNLSSKDQMTKPDFSFGLPVLSGVILINMILINLVPILINDYPNYVQAVFFGIILGSINVPLKSIKNKTFVNLSIIVATTIMLLIITGLKPNSIVLNPNPFYLFVSAILAVLAMLLPGISGSYILMLFGVYEYIINLGKSLVNLSINISQLTNLFVFILGAICSLLLFVKYIKIGFTRYNDITFSILVGCILGSLRVIVPFYEPVYENGKLVDKIFHSPLDYSGSYNMVIVFLLILCGFLFIKLIQRYVNNIQT